MGGREEDRFREVVGGDFHAYLNGENRRPMFGIKSELIVSRIFGIFVKKHLVERVYIFFLSFLLWYISVILVDN